MGDAAATGASTGGAAGEKIDYLITKLWMVIKLICLHLHVYQ